MPTSKNQYRPSVVFHPGETLAEKLEEMGMGPKEFALRTGKPEKTVIAILKGNSSITPEMAVQFEHVLKIPAHFWLNMQRCYDEYLAREERKEILRASNEWAKKFPYADMVKKGWVAAKSPVAEKTAELLTFFGFSDSRSWEKYYFTQQLKVTFRISLAHIREPYAISAWLREGELQAAKISAKAYNEKAFKESLPGLKEIMAGQPRDFFSKLQETCLMAGVKVIHTPCIKRAPINGCTRWINNYPVIQLTGRYKRNDIFWFTFFHEVGHLLIHGKKDIFLEAIEYSDKDKKKEEEANDFAVRWTLTEEEEQEIIAQGIPSEKSVLRFAKKFKTHPAIIVGRLQHHRIVPFSFGHHFVEAIELN